MVIDFHIHTKYSFDCFLEPARIVNIARKLKIEGLAVTDHDTMAAVSEFKKIAPELYIISGQEISTNKGDILGLFLKQEIRSGGDHGDVIKEIRSQGGIAVLAHPFKWPHLYREADFLSNFDALEIFNARNNIPVPYLENFLCKRIVEKNDLAFVAGSDTHQGFELGRAKTIFDFSAKYADDSKIKNAILKKQLKIEGQEVFLPLEIVSHFSRNIRSLLSR